MILNLQLTRFRNLLTVKSKGGKTYVFDPIRKKDIVLTPEEMTRQLWIHYLVEEKKYSSNLIQVEKKIEVHSINRRYDLIAYDRNFKPFLLLECKSHKIKLQQNTFDQIGHYNMGVEAPYLLISNGFDAYCYHIDNQHKKIISLASVPDFPN